MLPKLRAALFAALALLAGPALAGQATYSMPLTGPSTFGDFLNTYLNPALAAALSNNSGATAPSASGQPTAYQWWTDTSGTPKLLKFYDGASWLTLANVDATGHLVTLTGAAFIPSGSAAPSNGLYLPAANTVGIAANGAGEVQVTSTALSPVVSDGGALGTASLQWSDLFLASGAVVNIANGDWVATHTTGVLTVGTGDLRVTTAGTNSASAVTVGGTQTLAGKTIDTASNTLKIAGTTVSAKTGSGSVVLGTSPTITTPVFTGLPTGTGVAAGATASTLLARDANANAAANSFLPGFTTTPTAAGTTTLTNASTYWQVFTGATTQTVVLPLASSLALGQPFAVINNSSGAVTVQSSGGNTVLVIAAGNTGLFTAVLTSGTTAASWSAIYISSGAGTGTVTSVALSANADFTITGSPVTTSGTLNFDWATAPTGSGAMVRKTSPALVTPDIGAATGASAVLTGTSANIIAAGRQGSTTPAFSVDASVASNVTGVKVTANASGSRANVAVTSSATDEGLSVDAKGAGTVRLGATSTGAVEFSRNAVPTASDGAALGTTALQWSDLFLASGGVINWANGNCTETHSSGLLTDSCPLSLGTTNALTAGTIELGNGSDTTLSRPSAGVVAVEGVNLNPGIPITSKSVAYTVVLADANTAILHPASDANARTFTIDSNANVAYPVGTTLTFINMVNTVTIAITSDTLTLIGAGTTGSRTLAANGMATAIKISSTAWVISGNGLT